MSMLNKNSRVAVFMGGTSGEREVSLASGGAVCDALRGLGYNVLPVILNRDSLAELNGEKVDVAFIAMHGRFGEDGQLIRLLNKRGIPCTGSTPAACALAMDKVRTKNVLARHGMRTPPYIVLCGDFSSTEADWLIRADIGYPCVLKPTNSGSSIGVSIVRNRKELLGALVKDFASDSHVLIERYIPGREFTCSVIAGRALPLIEVRARRNFYDYHAKYKNGTEYILEHGLSRPLYEKMRKLSVAVHNAVGASGMSRVDMILSEDNVPFVLEINLIPGLTARSLLPKAALEVGIHFGRLCEMLLELALEKPASYNYLGERSATKTPQKIYCAG